MSKVTQLTHPSRRFNNKLNTECSIQGNTITSYPEDIVHCSSSKIKRFFLNSAYRTCQVYRSVDHLPNMEGKRVLIVGAGLTGAMTAAFLRKSSLPLTLTVWDKANGAGGRMSTHRDPSNPNLSADMGAQYISKTRPNDSDQAHEALKGTVYEDLLSSNVLRPFHGQIDGVKKNLSVIQNYVCPQGINGIVKHFLAQSGADVAYRQCITGVHRGVDDKGRPTPGEVVCVTSNGEESFDGVVLTSPVPQLLNLHGDILEEMDRKLTADLKSVTYSSRYALGLFYKDAFTRAETWSAKYFDDPILRFAAWDTAKRGSPSSHGSSLVLHTSVPFGIQHLEDDKEEVKELIMQKAVELIPGLQDLSPVHSHVIRWRYSQVFQGYPGSPGCVVLSCVPLVVATGDAFCGSNFESCIKAAQSTASTVIGNMTGKEKRHTSE